MKKIFVCALLAVVLISACLVCGLKNGSNTAFASEENASYQTSDAYLFVKRFLEACPSRSSVAHQRAAAEWLAEQFQALSTTLFDDALAIKTEAFGQSGSILGYNLSVRLSSANGNGKQVIVGAHYDSTGAGVNDNASGIAALWLILKSLAGAQLPFDVVFAAFGGEEQGLLGSQYYLENMTSAERQNTLVMFNLDSIGGGDNLYLFCENKHTDLADLILSCASGGSALTEKPYAAGVFPVDVYGYGYYEYVQGSDHTTFRLQNIATATFFAGNYSGWTYAESADDEKCVMNTNSDTLANMEAFWGGEFVSKIETVAATVAATLTSTEFLTVAENAQSQLVNNNLVFGTLWPTLAVALLLGITALFGWLYYRKLQKYALLGTAEAVNRPEVFTKPDAEDIFDMDDTNK